MHCAARILCLTACLGVSLSSLASADDAAPAADPAAEIQGEYLGVTAAPLKDWNYGSTGLQVVALGKGNFAAQLLAGGLPGAGWDRKHSVQLKGSLGDSGLVLEGEGVSIRLNDGRADVLDADGQFRGQLARLVRVSPSLGASAPPEAVVIFDGKETDELKDPKITEDGLLEVGTQFVNTWRDYTLHLEFRLPFMPTARGQGRANSGVYLQSRYEVQILDSFGLEGKFNECGSLYRSRAPDLNMCLPPLQWQTYDICFRAPRFDDEGAKTENARLSVWHNGTLIHDNIEVENKTGAGAAEGPKPLPIKLQNHSNPVLFRNIWLVQGTDCPSCPFGTPLLTDDDAAAPSAYPAGSGYKAASPRWPMRYGWYGPMPPPRPAIGAYRPWQPPASFSAIAYPRIP